MADIRSRIQLLEAMSANYQDLLGFARTANAIPDRSANMATLVENLERTVPEVSAAGPASQTATIPPDPFARTLRHRGYGLSGRNYGSQGAGS